MKQRILGCVLVQAVMAVLLWNMPGNLSGNESAASGFQAGFQGFQFQGFQIEAFAKAAATERGTGKKQTESQKKTKEKQPRKKTPEEELLERLYKAKCKLESVSCPKGERTVTVRFTEAKGFDEGLMYEIIVEGGGMRWCVLTRRLEQKLYFCPRGRFRVMVRPCYRIEGKIYYGKMSNKEYVEVMVD